MYWTRYLVLKSADIFIFTTNPATGKNWWKNEQKLYHAASWEPLRWSCERWLESQQHSAGPRSAARRSRTRPRWLLSHRLRAPAYSPRKSGIKRKQTSRLPVSRGRLSSQQYLSASPHPLSANGVIFSAREESKQWKDWKTVEQRRVLCFYTKKSLFSQQKWPNHLTKPEVRWLWLTKIFCQQFPNHKCARYQAAQNQCWRFLSSLKILFLWHIFTCLFTSFWAK